MLQSVMLNGRIFRRICNTRWRYFTAESPSTSQQHHHQQQQQQHQDQNEAVLNVVNEPDFNVQKACQAVIDLRSPIADKHDPRLMKLTSTLAGPKVDKLGSRAVMSCLKAVETLDLECSSEGEPKGQGQGQTLRPNLENALLWRARTASMRELVLLLSFARSRHLKAPDDQRTGESRLLSEVIRSLERRWVEVVDARIIVGILHYEECFSKNFLQQIDDRIIEEAENMTPAELTSILSKLGEKRRRSIPLLKSVSFHLSKNSSDLNIKEISDCLFAINRLSFRDRTLIEAVLRGLGSSLDRVEKPAPVRSLLTSLGLLKYSDPDLMDRICRWMDEKKDILEDKDLVTFLLTSAALNYIPRDSDSLFRLIEERIRAESVRNHEIWLDVVWSLCVLGKHTKGHLQSVLNPDFYERFLEAGKNRTTSTSIGSLVKILNVNAVMNGDLHEDPLLADLKLPQSADKAELNKTALAAFASLASAPAYAAYSINSKMGFAVEAEAVFQVDGGDAKPLNYAKYGLLAGLNANSNLVLPKNAKRYEKNFFLCLSHINPVITNPDKP